MFWSSASILNCCCWFCNCIVTMFNVFFKLFNCALWSYNLWKTSLYCWSSLLESWSMRSGCICWNIDLSNGLEGLGTGFFWGLDIVKMSGMAFACVICVVRILCAEHGNLYGCSVCCTLEAVKCGFYMRGTKIFAFYKRIRPKHTKIWWGIGVENFALESVCAALRIWVDYE